MLIKGLHGTNVEPLNSILNASFKLTWEQNSSYQLEFSAYDDGSVSFELIDAESSVFFKGQEYIVKQCIPDFNGSVPLKQIVATHVYNEVERIRQRKINTGAHTYSVEDVLQFYLSHNTLGFTYQVIGTFDKMTISDLGNSSGKDMLSKLVSTWPSCVIYPDNRCIRVYASSSWLKDMGGRIDYLNSSREIQLTYDSTNIINQIMVYGKTKDTGSDKPNYYFTPHLVKDESSIAKWGLREGEDLRDERFTDAKSMDNYAKTQLSPEPSLSISIQSEVRDEPVAGEQMRLEVRNKGFVTHVQVVGYVWFPFDESQVTEITLNNTAGTILDYQHFSKNELNDSLRRQKNLEYQLSSVSEQANQAFNSRFSGLPIKNTEAPLPSFTLLVPEDNPDMGLTEGQTFYVSTHASVVDGLDDFVREKSVQSVNGQTGQVTLSAHDIGALDVTESAESAKKLENPVKINGVLFDGTKDITIPLVDQFEKRLKVLEETLNKEKT
ncbi:hypothetical protein RU85_GL000706 [Lactococcus garvieae]|nr:hypothetical protein RU85_GL000706 [Lactococcus garvieae]